MSKFNQHAMSNAVQEYWEVYGNTPTPQPTHATQERRNLAGGQSYSLSPELDLYSRVCTMGLADKFYKSEDDQMQELIHLIKRNTPSFVAKLAIYAREKMYLRSIPMVLAVELAKIHRGDQLVSRTVSRVIKRADEITEILAYYQKANGRDGQTKKLNKLSNQIKKGVREAFQDGRFDEYQFAKYNRGTEVKFRDAMFLTHPKPQDKAQKLLFDKIVNDQLEVPYTWEVEMSNKDNLDKRQVWEQLIESNRLGYMALMRNIRNFLKEGVSERHIKMVCETIADQDKVLKSKQLPFRYLSAYRALVEPTGRWGSYRGDVPDFVKGSPYVTRLIEALETAISYSVANLPLFGSDNVLCATDVSGSMITPLNPRSSVQYFDVGALLCMIAKKASLNSCAGMFGNTFKTIQVGNQILNNVQEIYKREGEVGYSTNGYKVLEWAQGHNQGFDRIMMFTDCQLYNSGRSRYSNDDRINGMWKNYKAKYPNAKLYLFDLAGYGAGVPVEMCDNDVHLIAGWSDKVFDILHRIEQGQSAVDEINSIQL